MSPTDRLYVRFAYPVGIRGTAETPVAVCRGAEVKLPQLGPYAFSLLMKLSGNGILNYTEAEEKVLQYEEWTSLAAWYRTLAVLLEHRCLLIEAYSCKSSTAGAVLSSCSPNSRQLWHLPKKDARYRLSRFAYIRRHEDEGLFIESPLIRSRIVIGGDLPVRLFQLLGTPITLPQAMRSLADSAWEEVEAVMTLFLWAGIAAPTGQDGMLGEDRHFSLAAWEFHDLLLHTRSRQQQDGITRGGTFRFLNRWPPPPPVKPNFPPSVIPLHRPDMTRVFKEDASFAEVAERRFSGAKRDRNYRLMDADCLGEFLFRTARIRKHYDAGIFGNYTGRPYPNAGALYEFEIYVALRSCPGLADGLYAYDPGLHALRRYDGANVEPLFAEALLSRPEMEPQVLVAVTARFHRVSWKYQSIAYSLLLKNAGVLLAYFYLTASAMNIPSFALGSGPLSRIMELTGSDPLQEFPVGEFVVGSRPAMPNEPQGD
ncbi:SagB family peptide dehydrogenase [Paenibacillus thailandensis]|uniref:SagB family peptide dehydrogenase n=1 Tax=Paenibacillus thailandensis TaxID=393250 RepID=A0ABW5QWB4_9BACL